jgi:polysaccharide deacetylase family protein (PEP-CTERM system associated)
MIQKNESECLNVLTCELEDWFHILDSPSVPEIEQWSRLPLRAERNVDALLQLFEDTGVRATFFCLGWMAERMPYVVRRCQDAGHEIGSHGYGHIMAHGNRRDTICEDVVRSKKILEDITGRKVVGFRCPGFSVRDDDRWFFDVIAEAGYQYDASVFPAHHGHGGFRFTDPGPHFLETTKGPLVEIPVSTVKIFGRRICLFGGGYLRITPLYLIRWGVRRLREAKQPLIVYVHPREIDPKHPRLPLELKRRFKCYVNLRSTMPKLKWLCEHLSFTNMGSLVEILKSGRRRQLKPSLTDQSKRIPIVDIRSRQDVTRSMKQTTPE